MYFILSSINIWSITYLAIWQKRVSYREYIEDLYYDKKLTKKEQLILDFLKDNNVDIEEVIDAIIKANGFVGVGLVRLQDIMIDAVKKHFKQESLDKIMNG